MWIIVYYSYGTWKTTAPFRTEQAAEKHADMYQRRQDYNQCITIMKIPVPCPEKPWLH